MSIDKSLILKSQLTRRRNVLSRTERIQKLTDEDRWKEGDSIYGLPKVKTLVVKRKSKKEKEAATAEETAAPAEKAPEEGSQPAAPAK